MMGRVFQPGELAGYGRDYVMCLCGSVWTGQCTALRKKNLRPCDVPRYVSVMSHVPLCYVPCWFVIPCVSAARL